MRPNPNNPGVERNLRPFKKGDKRTIEAGRKGGRTRSLAKSQAARLKGWKQKLQNGNLKQKDIDWIMEISASDKSFAIGMLEWMERNKQLFRDDPKDVALYANTMNNIFKSVHGEKLKVQSLSVNVNVGDDYAKDILDKVFGKKHKVIDV